MGNRGIGGGEREFFVRTVAIAFGHFQLKKGGVKIHFLKKQTHHTKIPTIDNSIWGGTR